MPRQRGKHQPDHRQAEPPIVRFARLVAKLREIQGPRMVYLGLKSKEELDELVQAERAVDTAAAWILAHAQALEKGPQGSPGGPWGESRPDHPTRSTGTSGPGGGPGSRSS